MPNGLRDAKSNIVLKKLKQNMDLIDTEVSFSMFLLILDVKTMTCYIFEVACLCLWHCGSQTEELILIFLFER